jgi:histidine ammonia-lyase
MIIQLTAAALVSENKVLAHPASVDSIPTSANQEDHVSMGSVSAIKLLQVLQNVNDVLAIELIINMTALDLRKEKSSPAIENVKSLVRGSIPALEEDRVMQDDIKAASKMIQDAAILKVLGLTLV